MGSRADGPPWRQRERCSRIVWTLLLAAGLAGLWIIWRMQKPRPSVIAIDGPAASGKSTLGRRLAEALNYVFLDTGVMYRAVTWAALHHGVDVHDESAVAQVAHDCPIDVRAATKQDGRTSDVLVDGQDITRQTRGPDVEANVSIVSAYRGVRLAMSEQQRYIGKRGRIVMVGRDIGTVVLPDADLKIYLDASVQERARRRYEQEKAQGATTMYEDTLEKVKERDRIDSTRDIAPLRAAPDAVIIDSDNLNADQVFERALKLCN
jgi:CMP/dCMP kinase